VPTAAHSKDIISFAHFRFPFESPLQINILLQMMSGAMCAKSTLAAIIISNSKTKFWYSCYKDKILMGKTNMALMEAC
jgi:hypothetical protein